MGDGKKKQGRHFSPPFQAVAGLQRVARSDRQLASATVAEPVMRRRGRREGGVDASEGTCLAGVPGAAGAAPDARACWLCEGSATARLNGKGISRDEGREGKKQASVEKGEG